MILHPMLEKVRSTSPTVYQEMLKSRLSLVLTIPAGFNFDDLEQVPPVRAATIFGAPLTTEGICTINQLIEHLKMPQNLTTEGIFRKSGLPSRMAKLQAALCTGNTLSIDLESGDQGITIHDVCCLLKRFISELPKPLLLGDRLSELWQQVQPSLGDARRLEAVQLLLLLLPAVNRLFFSDLVALFSAVVAQSSTNKMTASNLAMVFMPILFLPKNVDSTVLASSSPTLTAALTFIINKGPEALEPPVSLLANAAEYLGKLTRMQKTGLGGPSTGGFSSMMSTTALIPSTKFCAPVETPKDYTQMMLAQLAEQVQAMPMSAAKNKGTRQLLKSLKKKKLESLTTTPLPKLRRDKVQQEMIREQLKHSAKASKASSSSIGSVIKRKLGLGGSGGSLPTPNGSNGRSQALKRKSVSGSALPPPRPSSSLSSAVSAATVAVSPLKSATSPRRSATSAAVPLTPPREVIISISTNTNHHQSASPAAVVVAPLQVSENSKLEVVVQVSPVNSNQQQQKKHSSTDAPALEVKPTLPAQSEAVSSSTSLALEPPSPPPLPPKPASLIKRKASAFSLPPATVCPRATFITTTKTTTTSTSTTIIKNGGGRSISAELTPTYLLEEKEEEAEHLAPRSKRRPQHISTPLKELSNRKKVTTQKEIFEAYIKSASSDKQPAQSMIPRLTRSATTTVSRKPSIPSGREEDQEDEEYVLLSKVTSKKKKEVVKKQQQLHSAGRVLRSSTNSPRSRVPVVVVVKDGAAKVSRTGSNGIGRTAGRRLVPRTPL